MEEKKFIVANWKMYKTEEEAMHFLDKLLPYLQKTKDSVWIAPPFTLIKPMSDKAKEMKEIFTVGAQNMNDADEGAFTGEISASMLKNVGAKFVILGHSERRIHFHESSEFINKKVLRAEKEKLNIILCVGESFDENQEGKSDEVIDKELLESCKNFPIDSQSMLYIAYEPLWAIGTGLVATPKIIDEKSRFIKKTASKLGLDQIKILYGGSVNPDNIASLLKVKEIVGFLVGGASLKPETFGKLISES